MINLSSFILKNCKMIVMKMLKNCINENCCLFNIKFEKYCNMMVKKLVVTKTMNKNCSQWRFAFDQLLFQFINVYFKFIRRKICMNECMKKIAQLTSY